MNIGHRRLVHMRHPKRAMAMPRQTDTTRVVTQATLDEQVAGRVPYFRGFQCLHIGKNTRPPTRRMLVISKPDVMARRI